MKAFSIIRSTCAGNWWSLSVLPSLIFSSPFFVHTFSFFSLFIFKLSLPLILSLYVFFNVHWLHHSPAPLNLPFLRRSDTLFDFVKKRRYSLIEFSRRGVRGYNGLRGMEFDFLFAFSSTWITYTVLYSILPGGLESGSTIELKELGIYLFISLFFLVLICSFYFHLYVTTILFTKIITVSISRSRCFINSWTSISKLYHSYVTISSIQFSKLSWYNLSLITIRN